MSKYIVVDNDEVTFITIFPPAVALGTLKTKINGNGHAKIKTKSICIEGDEKTVELKDIKYTSGLFTVPGTADLTIEKLNGDQLADHVFNENKVIIIGSFFTATLTVSQPAQAPPVAGSPPMKDPMPTYSGKGQFSSINNFVEV